MRQHFRSSILQFRNSIFLFLGALIAGILNSIAGGGSFVSFPALLFAGLPAVQANATNTVALWPGLAASSLAYLKRLDVPRRLLVPLLVTSIIGGLTGGVLLIKTPQHTFLHLVPWLMLAGTLMFAFGHRVRALAGKTASDHDLRQTNWQTLMFISGLELLIGIYGGYFGAGIGFITLGMLAALGMRNIHAMNALRTLLAVVINVAAVATFIAAGMVFWPQCLVMIAGSLTGGWFGAHYSKKADPKVMRYLVIAVGLAMSTYFFATVC